MTVNNYEEYVRKFALPVADGIIFGAERTFDDFSELRGDWRLGRSWTCRRIPDSRACLTD